MALHVGFSDDGVEWRIDENPIVFPGDKESFGNSYAYDPRVCMIDGEYYVTWCNGCHGPTIGVAKTADFVEFRQLENAFLPYNRNGVLFPRKINGNYAMLSRPSDNGDTPFGDIFFSESPDLEFWGRHRHVFSPRSGWDSTKVGAGAVPIETDQGWLIFYHGVRSSCNGFVYAMGAALLDIEKPWKVISRPKDYLLGPAELYECMGDTPNVVFPCAALVDSADGRIAVYYGAADTSVCLAFTDVESISAYLAKG